MDIINILIAVSIIVSISIVAAILLAIAENHLVVNDYAEEKVDKIEFYLPSYNCGACGRVNCRQVAKEIVEGKVKEVSVCKVISNENAKLIVDYCKEHDIKIK